MKIKATITVILECPEECYSPGADVLAVTKQQILDGDFDPLEGEFDVEVEEVKV